MAGASRSFPDEYAKGRYEAAYDAFARADATLPAPTVVARMADCKRQLGDRDAARALYPRAAGWPLEPSAPAAYREAKARAQRELELLDEPAAPVEPAPELPDRPAPASASPRLAAPSIAAFAVGGQRCSSARSPAPRAP